MRWIVLAGEYPPVIGGVAQHTYGIVAELSRRGHAVSVISGLQERWTSRGLPKLSALIDREPRPRRLLVPYAPNVFGCRGMNFAICGWLQERSRTGDEIHLIVHEPFYPWRLVDKPSRWILAAAQRHMMRRLLGASTRVYVSTSAWEPMVRSVASRSIAIEQLPSFSNVPVCSDREAAVAARRALLPDGEGRVIGTFGAQPRWARQLLLELVTQTAASTCRWLFIGNGSDEVVRAVAAASPARSRFVAATGTVDERSLSVHLQACDVMVQPYVDGVTTRRTTAMAALAHAVPLVTNEGRLTETLWQESAAVCLVPSNAGSYAAALRRLVAEDARRRGLGALGAALYDARFAVRHAVDTILQDEDVIAAVAVG